MTDPFKPSLDVNLVKEKIPSYSSEKLSEMIICDRYFGGFKEIALACMAELAKRRIMGDNFDFEKYIDDGLATLPKLEVKLPDLGDMLRKAVGNKI